MVYIVGHLYASGGLSWQVLGPMGSGADEEAVTINFGFHGSPPTARDARRIVREELSRAENGVDWFSVKDGKWVLDLTLMRKSFSLASESYAWLNRVVAIEPEYNLVTDTFNKTEIRGVLALVIDQASLREAEEFLAPPRPKQQKFGILDAPNLFTSDLDACRTPTGGHGTGVIYFDLDHFKKLNTELTERVVDRSILPAIHECIRSSLAGLGHAYAEGGDEFLALLPNANEAIAVAVAEALRSALSTLRLVANDRHHGVTASFGVATTESWSLDELADAANRAKREAKEAGRDRVVVARPRAK